MLIAILIICILLGLLFFIAKLESDVTTWYVMKFGREPSVVLRDKVVWIVGASSGIGASLAIELAAAGSKLVLSGRNLKLLEEVKEKCINANHRSANNILVLPFDITELETHGNHLAEILNKFGRVDILINNAGRVQISYFEKTTETVDRAIFEVNVFGIINLTRHVVRHWTSTGRKGHIVVTSSISGKQPAPVSSTYAASKHALHGFFNTLRVEIFRKGITVSLMCPGPVSSDILSSALTENMEGHYIPEPVPANNIIFMTPARCARIMLFAIANKLTESWICRQPILIFYYLNQYMPSTSSWLYSRAMNDNLMEKIRKGKAE